MMKRFVILPVLVPTLVASAWAISQVTWQPALEKSPPKSVLSLSPLPEFGVLAALPLERPNASLPTPQIKIARTETVTALDEFSQVISLPSQSVEVVKSTQPVEPELLDLADVDLTGLSPELVARVESALISPNHVAIESENDAEDTMVELERSASVWQGRLPQLNLQTHIYASDSNRRWVKVNGQEYRQQEWINDQVKLIEIQPQRVVVEFEGTKISMPALYEWQG